MDPSKATDTQLLERYEKSGEQSVFEEIVRRHGPMVHATALRVTGGSIEDSEDALQATFFALAMSVGRIREKASIAGWLHKAARSSALKVQRSNVSWEQKRERMMNRLRRSRADRNAPNPSDASSSAEQAELQSILDEELANLPKQLQAALVLCDLEGLSRTRAAKELGLPRSTVDEHVVKGRRVLRDRLMRRGLTLPATGLAGFAVSAALSSEAVAATAKNSVLFAAGKTAAEIGASPVVAHVALKVASAMTGAKLLAICCAAVTFLALSATIPAFVSVPEAQQTPGTVYVDNFDDGNAADGIPAAWSTSLLQPTTVDASSGDLVIRSNGSNLIAAADAVGIDVRNVSVRTRAKVTGGTLDNENLAIVVRTPDVEDTRGYFAVIGHERSFGNYVAAGVGLTGNKQDYFFSSNGRMFEPLMRDVRSAYIELQIDVFDREINVWAWPAGDEMPAEPQFSTANDTYVDAGHVRLYAHTNGTATFKFVHVSKEPIRERSSDG